MAALGAGDFRKAASGGPYAGQDRHKIFEMKIKDGKEFILGSTKHGPKVIGVSYDKKSGELTYKKTKTAKKFEVAKYTRIFKDADFGGGAGSGGGAEDTKFTESMQCYYCSYVFNVARKKITSATDKQLAQGVPFVQATKSLKQCIEGGPPDWVDTDVYIKTANKLWEKFGNKFKGKVYFHRGSGFMDTIYKMKTQTHSIDKKSGDPQAPGSFSHDKWNPGDIWASTFPPNSNPLQEFTSSWGELNEAVLEYAGVGKTETKLLAISLKKIGAGTPQARLTEFGKKNRKKPSYKFKSFKYGKTGDFFGSQDIYIETDQGEVQFRTFGGETSWQGEIKGGDAAGGKIGGGNVDFFCKQVFRKGIYGKFDAEAALLSDVKKNKKIIEDLYSYYSKYNSKSKPSQTLLTYDEFATKYKETFKSKSYKYTNSKFICMLFLDTIMSGTAKQRDEFVTKMFRYAQSDVDQSSYFVKLY